MQHIGRYPLTTVVGSGGFGTVYRSTDPETGELVAVKLLRWPRDGQRRALFRSEARALLAVDHPNVVRVREVIDTPELAALVTDFVEGASLREVLRQLGSLDGPQALGVLVGALSGLAAVHDAGLVHADLKPENIVVDVTGTSRLIDFGLAGPPRRLEGPGTWSGTPTYISPEQVAGQHVDARSDIYQAAVVLFELLCGRPPYRAETADLTAALHVTAPVPDPRTVTPGLGEGLAAICVLDLAKDPARRHQNVRAFATSLEHAARERYGAAWTARAGLAGVIGGVVAALPAGAGLLGSAGITGTAVAGAAASVAVGGAGAGAAGGAGAGAAGGAGAGAAGGMGAGAASASGIGAAKLAAIGVASAVAVTTAGGVYVANRDRPEAPPAAAAPASPDVFAYTIGERVVVVRDGAEVARVDVGSDGPWDDADLAWSDDGGTLAVVDGATLTLVDVNSGTTRTSPCTECSEVALWDERVVTVEPRPGSTWPRRLVARPVEDLANPRNLLTDPPPEISWEHLVTAGPDLVATGNNQEESGAKGAADVYVVHTDGSATRVGDHATLNTVFRLAGSGSTAYGGPRVAAAFTASGGFCTTSMYPAVVDPTNPDAVRETDKQAMFPDPPDYDYFEAIGDLWFGADGVLRASAHRVNPCPESGGATTPLPIRQWRLEDGAWVLDDDRPVLGARDLPSGVRVELVAHDPDPSAEAAAGDPLLGTLTLVEGEEETVVADSVTRVSAPPPDAQD